ncbi:MAG: ABC transporter permease subunit [Acidobacteriota bacterium]|nr:ABC transporter permease subunit [Acidobacteriota bacterium]
MLARALGASLVAVLLVLVIAGDRVAPNTASEQFVDRAWSPPMRLQFERGQSFVHAQRLEDRLARTFSDDASRRVPVDWFADGRLLSAAASEPVLLLGADALGRDVLARVAGAARWSLGVAVAGALLALALGTLLGAAASAGNRTLDRIIVSVADALASLPVVYIVLTLRAALPLVLSPETVFVTLALLFGLVGWPFTARGARGIFMRERALPYADAARAAGASRSRIFRVHLLPASLGFLVTQFLLLVPGFLISEVTLSFLGLGFPEPTPSWGTMLQAAANVRVIAEAPWMLAPAVAIALTSLALHLLAGTRHDALTVFSRAR